MQSIKNEWEGIKDGLLSVVAAGAVAAPFLLAISSIISIII